MLTAAIMSFRDNGFTVSYLLKQLRISWHPFQSAALLLYKETPGY